MDDEVFERWQAKRQTRKRNTSLLPIVVVGVLVAALAVPVSSALLAGPATTRALNFTGFDGVSAAAGVDVKLAQGPFAVSANGTGGDLDDLDIRLDGTTLKVGRKPSLNFIHISFSDTTLTVTAPGFARVEAAAGADIEGEGLTLTDVKLVAAAGADITLKGACTSVTAEAAAGADIVAKDLVCQRATATAAAGADVSVHATEAATAHAGSGGDVKIYGKPRNVTQDVDTGGDVRLD